MRLLLYYIDRTFDMGELHIVESAIVLYGVKEISSV